MTGDYQIAGVQWLHEGWSRYGIAKLRLPDGTELDREMEDHGCAVCVLPYNPNTKTALLVRQPRTAFIFVDPTLDLLEAPAGKLERADIEEETRREAMEEVGVRLGPLERVVDAWSMPGISTERITLFLAPFTAADRTGIGGGPANEQEAITVDELSLLFWPEWRPPESSPTSKRLRSLQHCSSGGRSCSADRDTATSAYPRHRASPQLTISPNARSAPMSDGNFGANATRRVSLGRLGKLYRAGGDDRVTIVVRPKSSLLEQRG